MYLLSLLFVGPVGALFGALRLRSPFSRRHPPARSCYQRLTPLVSSFPFPSPPPPCTPKHGRAASTPLFSSKEPTEGGSVSSVSRVAKTTLGLTAASSLLASRALAATGKSAAAGPHLGQRLAGKISAATGLSDRVVLAVIAAIPVVELRGSVPVGLWMGLPLKTVFPLAVIGNMLPIIPLMLLLKSSAVQKLFKPLLDRAESKASSVVNADADKQWAALAAFVGVPLPGTGAWTGALAAFVLGMPLAASLSAIFAGVVSAGVIMSALTLSGRKGGAACLAALLTYAASKVFASSGDKKQTFLEASPYYDQSTVPLNTYKNKDPYTAKVVSTKRIVGPKVSCRAVSDLVDAFCRLPPHIVIGWCFFSSSSSSSSLLL